jgi:hypothetical protein
MTIQSDAEEHRCVDFVFDKYRRLLLVSTGQNEY